MIDADGVGVKVAVHASLDLVDDLRMLIWGLEEAGAQVLCPDLRRFQHIRDVDGDDLVFDEIKRRLACEAIDDLRQADGLVVHNGHHRSIDGYVGGQSFLKMVLAFAHSVPIILTNPIPVGMPYTEEIRAFAPCILGLESPHEMVRRIREFRGW